MPRPRHNHKFTTRFTIQTLLFTLAALQLAVSCTSIPRHADTIPVIAQRIEDFVPQWRELHTGIELSAGKIKYPRLEFWALRVNLADKNIEIVVNETSENTKTENIQSITVSGFAAKYDCIAAINAGPFSPVSTKVGEERILTGIFVSNGKPVSPPNPRYSALLIYNDGHATVTPQHENIDLDNIRSAIGGFYTILENDALIERKPLNNTPRQPARHPRSAAGVSSGGSTLYLLLIDGRRIASIGATEQETGLLLRALGGDDGILMDGGGSSALALNTDGAIHIINKPVHGGVTGRERAVATCIGVRVKPQR
ncbi:MAG: phosphodiester glycosidase family protein [Spirochaetaceae bacterium]|jgi:exopolysaccharide biosynthesis protein|nr:phosphodiester glycosidase family protein [Spirochaetaceae bacterium]